MFLSLRHLLHVLIATIMLAGMITSSAYAQQATPVDTDEQLAAVLPEWHDALADVLDSVAARYTIDAEVDASSLEADAPTLNGMLAVDYTNTTDTPLEELPFRLYANNEPGSQVLQVSNVTRDGETASTAQPSDPSILTVPLDPALPAGSDTTITLDFTLTMPVDERLHYGILNADTERGTWAMAHWYPIIAGWTDERGWILDPPSEHGDPIFSNTSSYDLTLRTPESWRVVSTGVVVDESSAGQLTERRIVTGPVRDLTMVLDDDFEVVEREVDGTLISSWYNPGEERSGEAALDYADQSLAYFNDIIGQYPYATLDLVPTNLFGAAGVEFPQLIYMGASYYRPEIDLDPPTSFDFTVAHEVVHQWWYGIVGNNQYDHAFIDEGLTNFMSAQMYFEEVYGPLYAEAVVRRYLAQPFESHVTTGNDQIVNTPTDDFETSSGYVFAAYNKAPMGFRAIYEAIGHDAFVEAMRIYYEAHMFTVATPDDLLNAFNTAASEDITELWNHWFEETSGEDDVQT